MFERLLVHFFYLKQFVIQTGKLVNTVKVFNKTIKLQEYVLIFYLFIVGGVFLTQLTKSPAHITV